MLFKAVNYILMFDLISRRVLMLSASESYVLATPYLCLWGVSYRHARKELVIVFFTCAVEMYVCFPLVYELGLLNRIYSWPCIFVW